MTNPRDRDDVIAAMIEAPSCITCNDRRRVIEMGDDTFGWTTEHDPDCPQHDDHAGGVQVRIDPVASLVADRAEAIWENSTDVETGTEDGEEDPS